MANFQTSNRGTWYFFDPDREESGGVCLRLLTPEEQKRIENSTVKTQKTILGGQLVEKREVNEKLEMELIYNYCIADWTEVELDGQPAKCTIQNKVRAMKSLDFARFVNQSLKTLAMSNKAIQEVLLKNSVNMSNGLKTSPTVEIAEEPIQSVDENLPVQPVE